MIDNLLKHEMKKKFRRLLGANVSFLQKQIPSNQNNQNLAY